MQKCNICGFDAEKMVTAADRVSISCPRCGDYQVSGSLDASVKSTLDGSGPNAWAILSHTIREMQQTGISPVINTYSVQGLLGRQLPTVPEQLKLLLKCVGGAQTSPAQGEHFSMASLAAILGTRDREGDVKDVSFILRYAIESDLLYNRPGGGADPILSLTFKGWEAYEEVAARQVIGRRAFMAMQYGDKDLDNLFATQLKPAASATGFELLRLNERLPAGLIDNVMREAIRDARFVVVDLTHGNRGAYWEAGYAEGLGKPVIYTCRDEVFRHTDEKQRPHFDTNHLTTILWNLNKPEAAAEELKATIRITLPHEATHEV